MRFARATTRLRRRLLLARLRLALPVCLVALPAGFAADVAAGMDQLGERLLGFALLGAVYPIAMGAMRWPRASRHPRLLVAGSTLALGAGLIHLLSLTPGDMDVLAGAVSCFLVGSSLVFPWGAIAQALVALPVAGGYLWAAWPVLAGAPSRLANVAITMTVCVILSVLGAWLLERFRQRSVAAHLRLAALAAQRRRLLVIGRDLRGTLDRDVLLPRLMSHAAALVPCEAVLVLLHDPATGTYHLRAASGDPTDEGLAEARVTLGRDLAAALTSGLAPAEVRTCPGSALDPVIMPILAPAGVRQVLVAAIGPHPNPAGFLVWKRRAEAPFTFAQRLAAQGIAEEAHIALSASGLYEAATRASRFKSDFVSTMSHELRTPLNVIIGYNQILRETLSTDDEGSRALDAIGRASHELLDLIDATLDLNRLEAGREQVQVERVALRDLIDELAGEFVGVPRAPGVTLSWDAGAAPTLTVDRRKLRTIVKNLVSNALKFTPAGAVRVECEADAERCRIRVADTGIGIQSDAHELIFEMFRQADGSDRRRYGGTGLGLYIVRRLTTLLGGTISLASTPGRGSTFTIELPLQPQRDTEREAA